MYVHTYIHTHSTYRNFQVCRYFLRIQESNKKRFLKKTLRKQAELSKWFCKFYETPTKCRLGSSKSMTLVLVTLTHFKCRQFDIKTYFFLFCFFTPKQNELNSKVNFKLILDTHSHSLTHSRFYFHFWGKVLLQIRKLIWTSNRLFDDQ